MRAPTIRILLTAAVLSACSASSQRPTLGPAPTTTTTLAPDQAAAAASHFAAVMAPSVAPTTAFVARLNASVPSDALVLPPDLIRLAAAAASAISLVTSHLRHDLWPPGVQDDINALIVASRTFGGDLHLITIGLAPNLLPTWAKLFFHDGATFNAAQNRVRSVLGLAVVPA